MSARLFLTPRVHEVHTMEMTSRERWLALLEGHRPDRIPTDYWATEEFSRRLREALGCEDDEAVARRLHIDRLRVVGPRCRLPHHPDDPEADIWGVRHQMVDYGTGSYNEAVHHPLAGATSVADIERYRWPGVENFDFQPVREALKTDDGLRAVRAGHYEPFLLYCSLRGMEQAYEDLLLNPEIAEAILGQLLAFFLEYNRRIFEAGQGRIDLFYLAEDLGAQTGPLISLELYRRFLRPGQQAMARLARDHGVHVFYHTDGAAAVFLPDLIDVVGIEVLNPIQWRCPGMDRQALAAGHGDKVVFHGAMDNQQTLPGGSIDDVRREVEENMALFNGARWICAPCHNIQPVTPVENVIAMYEHIHAIGRLN
ncbi:MAG: hypothetical protein JJU36_13475 [Phycisphaeraceae bacterium]|nr:hypothetical protein [Phycisphaeraceae bacterium]